MTFLREDQIQDYARRQGATSTILREGFTDGLLKKASATNVFLSNSHSDQSFVEQVVYWLSGQGLNVYVDWMDSPLVGLPSGETAQRIRAKIREYQLTMLLATNAALDSRWVPWEIGYADGAKGSESIIILPIADRSGAWRGSEYLQLYRSVVSTSSGGWAVFAPGQG